VFRNVVPVAELRLIAYARSYVRNVRHVRLTLDAPRDGEARERKLTRNEFTGRGIHCLRARWNRTESDPSLEVHFSQHCDPRDPVKDKVWMERFDVYTRAERPTCERPFSAPGPRSRKAAG
jgi:hypothetical protein